MRRIRHEQIGIGLGLHCSVKEDFFKQNIIMERPPESALDDSLSCDELQVSRLSDMHYIRGQVNVQFPVGVLEYSVLIIRGGLTYWHSELIENIRG